MTSGVICTAGITAKIRAEIYNTTFNPNVVKVSNQLLECTGSETVLPHIVWTAPSSSVVQVSISSGIMRTIVYMDLSVGDFDIATFGIFDSVTGVLFALAAFPGAGSKLAYSPPLQAGNIRTFYIDIAYADISNALSGSITDISTLTLEQALANASGAVTARQLRTALNNRGLLGTVEAALARNSHAQAAIDWETCASVSMNSTLLNFVATATSQFDQGAAILSAAMLLPA